MPDVQQPDYTRMGLADQLNAYARMASGMPPAAPGGAPGGQSNEVGLPYDPGSVDSIMSWLTSRWQGSGRVGYPGTEDGQQPQPQGQNPSTADAAGALGHHHAGWVDPTLQSASPQGQPSRWRHGFRPDQPYSQGSPANVPGAAQDAMQRGRGLYGWNPMDQQRGALSQMMARRPRQSNWDAYGY